MPLTLTIRTPDKECFHGPVDSVILHTELGEMQIFPGHAALQGSLSFSVTKIQHQQTEEEFLVQNGLVVIKNGEEMSILAFACDKREEIDLKSAKQYMEYILSLLEKRENLTHFQIKFLEDQHIALIKTVETLDTTHKAS